MGFGNHQFNPSLVYRLVSFFALDDLRNGNYSRQVEGASTVEHVQTTYVGGGGALGTPYDGVNGEAPPDRPKKDSFRIPCLKCCIPINCCNLA